MAIKKGKGRHSGQKRRTQVPLSFLIHARRACGMTQAQAAERVYISQAALSNLENGAIYDTKGQLKPNVTKSIHDLAGLYHRPELEEFFCTHLCPIGQSRKQLQYQDFQEIWTKLEVSLRQLEQNSSKIARTMEDGQISESEWKDWPRLVQNMSEISYLARSADLWAQVLRGEVKESREPEALSPNAYQEDRAAVTDQRSAAELIGISASKLSTYERETDRARPTPDEALCMSRAYLSPRIRNFYCYHDCEIGGTMEPLDIRNEYQVSLMMVSSLLYVKDLRDQFSMALTVHGTENPDPNGIQQYLEQLNELSRRVDTIILWTQQSVCGRLLEILSDYQVTEDERKEYQQLLGYLEQLGTNSEQLEELRGYLN